MQKCYTINNCEFIPDKNIVYRIDEPDKKILLNTPASKCLSLLLSSNGAVVTHEQLYQFAWAGEKFEPLPNTLYQNISIVRRAMRDIGLDEPEFIITIPRKGFKIKGSIAITLSAREDSEDNFTQGIKVKSPVVATLNDKESTRLSNTEKNNALLIFNSHGNVIVSVNILVFLILISTISFFMVDFDKSYNKIFDSYIPLSNKGKCNNYINPQNNTETVLDPEILSLDCAEYPYNYITKFNVAAMSVISCRRNITSASVNYCRTTYFKGSK